MLIPLYRMGEYNDFVMRVSIPSLLVLWIGVAQTLTGDLKLKRAKALLGLFILGSLTGLNEIARSVDDPTYLSPVVSLPKLSLAKDQYMGSDRSFFFTRLAKDIPKEIPKDIQ
jgi:hypothetical protein